MKKTVILLVTLTLTFLGSVYFGLQSNTLKNFFLSLYSVPKEVVSIEVPPDYIYFTGVPKNATAQSPNIFRVDINSRNVEQVTGLNEPVAFHASYYRSKFIDHEYYMFATDRIGQARKIEPFAVFTEPNQPTELVASSFIAEAGVMSRDFSLSPDERFYSYTTLYPANSTNPVGIEAISTPATWTTIIGEVATTTPTNYLSGVTKPVWLSNEIILVLADEFLITYNVIAQEEVERLPASEFGLEKFSASDSFTFLSPSTAVYYLVLASKENRVFNVVKIDSFRNGQAEFVETNIAFNENSFPSSVMRLSKDTFAYVEKDLSGSASDVVHIVKIENDQFTKVRSVPLSNFEPSSTSLDYWLPSTN